MIVLRITSISDEISTQAPNPYPTCTESAKDPTTPPLHKRTPHRTRSAAAMEKPAEGLAMPNKRKSLTAKEQNRSTYYMKAPYTTPCKEERTKGTGRQKMKTIMCVYTQIAPILRLDFFYTRVARGHSSMRTSDIAYPGRHAGWISLTPVWLGATDRGAASTT